MLTMIRKNLLHSSWIFYIIGIVVLSFSLTSCMMHEKYPAAWGDLVPVEENKCPDISGIYRNSGSSVHYNLSKILGFEDELNEEYVQITQLKDDSFEISGWDTVGDEQKLVYKNSYPKRKYTCTPEGIRASSYTESINRLGEGLGALGVGHGFFYLRKNTDGDLIVKNTGTAIGFSFLFPVLASATEWYKFPKF